MKNLVHLGLLGLALYSPLSLAGGEGEEASGAIRRITGMFRRLRGLTTGESEAVSQAGRQVPNVQRPASGRFGKRGFYIDSDAMVAIGENGNRIHLRNLVEKTDESIRFALGVPEPMGRVVDMPVTPRAVDAVEDPFAIHEGVGSRAERLRQREAALGANKLPDVLGAPPPPTRSISRPAMSLGDKTRRAVKLERVMAIDNFIHLDPMGRSLKFSSANELVVRLIEFYNAHPNARPRCWGCDLTLVNFRELNPMEFDWGPNSLDLALNELMMGMDLRGSILGTLEKGTPRANLVIQDGTPTGAPISLAGSLMSGVQAIGIEAPGLDLTRAVLAESSASIGGGRVRDFDAATFGAARLGGADLTRVDATAVDFRAASLSKATLTEMNATGANFERASLSQAIVLRMNRLGANFKDARADRVNWRQARALPDGSIEPSGTQVLPPQNGGLPADLLEPPPGSGPVVRDID